MAAPRPKKRALSDRLKNMRFMKRREETSLREKLIESQKQRAKDARWTIQVDAQEGKTAPVVLIEDGISGDPLCALHGRQSFGKFNTVFESDAPLTCSNNSPPNLEQTNDSHTNSCLLVDPEDEKSCKEEPLLAAGLTRLEHSKQEKHPQFHKTAHLEGPRRTIFKKKRKRTGSMKS